MTLSLSIHPQCFSHVFNTIFFTEGVSCSLTDFPFPMHRTAQHLRQEMTVSASYLYPELMPEWILWKHCHIKKAEDKLCRLCSPPPLSCLISYHFESCGSHKPQVQLWHGVQLEAWGEGENTISPSGLQHMLIILCSLEVRGVMDLSRTIVVLGSSSWCCLLLRLFAGIHTVPKFASGTAYMLCLRKLQKNWIELPCPLRQKNSHPFTVGSPVTSHRTYWLQLLWKETSLPLLGDLLCCQDLSQSHHQGTLVYLLLVMTLHILQLHSLEPLPLPPKKTPHVLHGVYPLNASSPVKSTACREGLPGIKKMKYAFQEK